MAQVKTVKVKDESTRTGYRIINESDFKRGKDQRWTPPPSEAPKGNPDEGNPDEGDGKGNAGKGGGGK